MTKELDYTILDQMGFEYKPVGVKYSMAAPEDVARLDRPLALCELFREAQENGPFYAMKEDIQCGDQLLGMTEFPPVMYSGALGPMFAMFKTPGANRRIYDYVPHLPKDSVTYITHAPTDQMDFDPDVLIFTCRPNQAEIIMRASSYSDGKMWQFKGTTCLACAWLYAHPYLSGEINLSISGMGYSMKARHVLPDGLIFIAVPFDQIAVLLDNLRDMEWEPDWLTMGREKFVESVGERSAALYKKLGFERNR
jgi:uncharacterized protein (DUF169 family)